MTDHERPVDELRPVAFAVAYRMLGTVSDAEDIVQETLLRLHRALAAGEHIDSRRGFVATVTTRLSIDELRSARARRGEHVGQWLPEPVITDSTGDPLQHAETLDSLSLAMLVLLESLSPEQRAVLLLRDVFDYDYDEIAAIVDKSEDNVRQLAARAATWSSGGRGFTRPGSSRRSRPIGSSPPPSKGDLAGLEALLVADVKLTGDGGGKASAPERPLRGRARVARTLTNWSRSGRQIPG